MEQHVNQMVCFADADHASDVNDRKSTSGYVITMNCGPVSWNVSKQKTPSSSPTESEYKSLHHATLEVIWLRQLIAEMGYAQQSATIINEDNESTIDCTRNPVSHSKMKHIDIKYHVIRDYIEQGQITVKWISTNEQLADMFTKPLPPALFHRFRNQLLHIQSHNMVEPCQKRQRTV
jgi:hypothetical protein